MSSCWLEVPAVAGDHESREIGAGRYLDHLEVLEWLLNELPRIPDLDLAVLIP